MKFLKYLFLAIVAIAILGFAYVKLVASEDRPTVVEGKDAQVMAQKMLSAINKSAWDTLPYIKWTFSGKNHYVWDRVDNKAIVTIGEVEVQLDPDEVTGTATENGVVLEGEAKDKAVQSGWSNWCNDMFWLSAPYKIHDRGTSLAIAKDEDGKEGLLVTYESGGVTPGDSYLWFLDDAGMPTGYKMWVSIIPIGGIYTSWEDWITVPGGAKIAQQHQGNISALKIPITDVKAGFSWSDLGYSTSPIK
ncbi:MAG: hypothetical protein ACJA01_000798 [Saprospiraceae bacterium]|jgi:hypothetical protein